MIVGIMQPYFFPYLEHFRLLAACDQWIVFDTVKYQRRSWMNRNRIINREHGWSYLSVPVRHAHADEPVCATSLAPDSRWRERIQGALRVYAHSAPFYDETNALIEELLAPECNKLVDLNVRALAGVCRALDIATPIKRLSELSLDLPQDCGPGEWALHIARALGASEYRNPAGGRELFDRTRFEAAGIELSFHEHRTLQYSTGPFEFVPDLSVIDVLMWIGRAGARSWLAASD